MPNVPFPRCTTPGCLLLEDGHSPALCVTAERVAGYAYEQELKQAKADLAAARAAHLRACEAWQEAESKLNAELDAARARLEEVEGINHDLATKHMKALEELDEAQMLAEQVTAALKAQSGCCQESVWHQCNLEGKRLAKAALATDAGRDLLDELNARRAGTWRDK